jgi:hypothetical protein
MRCAVSNIHDPSSSGAHFHRARIKASILFHTGSFPLVAAFLALPTPQDPFYPHIRTCTLVNACIVHCVGGSRRMEKRLLVLIK